MIYENAFFIAQVGLFLNFICSFGIIHLVSTAPARPPWYYFVLVWLTGSACAVAFGWGCTQGAIHHPLALVSYSIAFIFGLERAGVFLSYWFKGRGRQLSTDFIQRVNYAMGAIALVIIAGVLGYIAYQETVNTKIDAADLKHQTLKTAAILDTRMQARNDSLTAEILKNREQGVALTKKINEQAAQIMYLNKLLNTLTEVIISLKQAIFRLNTTVERSRKSTFTPSRVTMPEQSTVVSLGRVPTAH